MRLLLTSCGISNERIQIALVGLLGKPIAESRALCIPTAAYGCGPDGPDIAWRLISGSAKSPLCGLGWKSVGVLELTALPGLAREAWVPAVRAADALLVGGGDPLYLRHWMRESGLAELFPSLRPETVYVGVSAGSMAVTAHIGETYHHEPPAGRDIATETIAIEAPDHAPSDMFLASAPGIGLVDFALFPHAGDEAKPDASFENIARRAARAPVPTYALDDRSAIAVTDGVAEVVSEGQWQLFTPQRSVDS